MITEKNSLEIKIGKLWNSAEGTTEKLELDIPVSFDSTEIRPVGNMVCDLLLVKLKGEIIVILSNFVIRLKTNCQKCLKDIEFDLNIKAVERSFLFNKPAKDEDPFENFLIDQNKMSVDLHDMVRQEIILHFPPISLCSKSCKGLCIKCGGDLNKKKCDCKQEEDHQIQQPFKDLKKLIKATIKPKQLKKKR